jgi:hypothetical protein
MRNFRKINILLVVPALLAVSCVSNPTTVQKSIALEPTKAQITKYDIHANSRPQNVSVSAKSVDTVKASLNVQEVGFTSIAPPPPPPPPKPEPVKVVEPKATAKSKSSSKAATPAPPSFTPNPGSAQAYAQQAVAARGWSESEFNCLVPLWKKESGWNAAAMNKSSGAYGIPQALPGSKMASAGADWQTNANTQIEWGLSYISGRYGTPCGAWGHSVSVGWY